MTSIQCIGLIVGYIYKFSTHFYSQLELFLTCFIILFSGTFGILLITNHDPEPLPTYLFQFHQSYDSLLYDFNYVSGGREKENGLINLLQLGEKFQNKILMKKASVWRARD